MNKRYVIFVKDSIKEGLEKCTDGQKNIFVRMYGNGKTDLNEIVDNMNEDKIDWALTQIENTLKLEK